MATTHEPNDTCLARFDRLEEAVEKRREKESIIEQAIIEIKTSSKLTAETLAELKQYVYNSANSSNDKYFKLIEKGLLILAGIIGALIGQKVL